METMYSRQVLQQYQNTQNVGDLENADAYVRLDNPGCGDTLQLAIRMANGRVHEAKFRARGCVAAVACAAQMMDMVSGKTVAELNALRPQDLSEALGGLPAISSHAAALAIDALAAALKQLA